MISVQIAPTDTGTPAGSVPMRRRGLAATVQVGARLAPEHVRHHNRALVLQALYRGEGLSRADLARDVGLTRVTISALVSDLIAEGIVVELGVRSDSRPGKPATVLDLNRSGFNVIALDLSKDAAFGGAITDLDGSVLHRHEVGIAGLTGQAAIDVVVAVLDTLMAAATVPVLGVGVGSPGIVDARGVVLRAPHLGWANVPLQDLLERHSGLPVLVTNDANAAALAERTFGTGDDNMMLVRIGRGVGAGLVVGGTLVHGASSAAGEIGHVVVGTDGGDTCVCGREGCLETWLAIPQLAERLAHAADANERDAVLAAAGERLGMVIAPVVGALNLREVVLSGPLDVLGGVLLDSAVATVRARTLPEIHGGSDVRLTGLGRDIVVLGAVVMVLMGQLGVS
jgi:predicted NBD/HSP70 family sugar kinase